MVSKINQIKSQLYDLRSIVKGSPTMEQSEKNFIDGYITSILIDVAQLKK